MMFEQYLADGANLFIAIVAVILGFAAATGFLNFKKESENNTED